MTIGKKHIHGQEILKFVLLAVGLSGLITTRFISFLLFHSLVELFSICIAAATFLIVWNTRDQIDNPYLLFLGIALLPIASLDLLHTLSYKGMNVLPFGDSNLPTQLWIAARSLEACVLLLAPFLIHHSLRSRSLLILFVSILVLILGLIFTGLFPDCYIEGQGLTTFKISAEYFISASLLLSIFFLYRRKSAFDPLILRYLISATIATTIGEIAFTFYIGVYDLSNVIGHIFKVIAFWFLYKALVETSLRQPVRTLVHNLLQSETALRLERDFSAAVFNTVGALIIVLDVDGKIVRANGRFEHALKLSPEQYLNHIFWELPVLTKDASKIRSNFERTPSEEEPVSYEAHLQTAGGYLHIYRWTNTVIRNSDSNAEYVIAVGLDMSEQKAAEDQLRFISTHDTLTGLYNRAFFEAELGRLQNSRLFPISIIMADLDNLKDLNDSSGHAAGDAALKELARIFTKTFRKEDIVARIGGDEFVVLLPQTDAGAAEEITNRIEKTYKILDVNRSDFQLNFSIGFATAEAGASLEETLARADQAMYTRKRKE
ncbi:MAG: diguanylate cyclase [Anaerolineales bacterium]|nr:diguanylate cyclase [Anaerolineales bacterium]